jgi:hypothetical protein
MKKIKIYALDGCDACKVVIDTTKQLIAEKQIELEIKYCQSVDDECDNMEDKLDTGKYPIVMLYNFSYSKEKFGKDNIIVYICSTAEELHTPVKFDSKTLAEGVLSKDFLLNKLKDIIL